MHKLCRDQAPDGPDQNLANAIGQDLDTIELLHPNQNTVALASYIHDRAPLVHPAASN